MLSNSDNTGAFFERTVMTVGALLEDYRPTTFLERGVAVPFTTPLLACARVRPTHRQKLEFVIANPSGGIGFYVMGWDGLASLTRITVHDRLLYETVLKEPLLSPGTIRAAGRKVALSGVAGRPAAKAAQAALAQEADDRLIANFLLIVRLLNQGGVGQIDWRRFNPSDTDLRTKTRKMVERMEPTLGAGAETIFCWLEELSAIVAPVGFRSRDYPARMPVQQASLEKLYGGLMSFGNTDATEAGQIALFAAEVAKLTLDLSAVTLENCYAELDNLVRLLQSWGGNRERLLGLFGRPDWLLDGWHAICALWDGASSRDAQREVLMDIGRMVPVMPKEVAEWVDGNVPVECTWNQRRWVKANVDWRSGTHLLDRTARNEVLRAVAA